MADVQELEGRLDDLRNGPWSDKARLARRYFAPESDLQSLASGDDYLDPEQLAQKLDPADIQREAEIGRILRWHGEAPITEDSEMVLRDSFDFALTYPMLLELAVETGYLPADYVRVPARREFTTLLWSDAARRFVVDYDYLGIEYLAKRVGVGGFRDFIPPEPNPEASVRFASFLAQHADLVSDPDVSAWLGFLDDYVMQEDEHDAFARTLDWGGPLTSDRFVTLATGLHQFVVGLSDLFGILEENEIARFGLFYSYWLARFFGYRVEKAGFSAPTRGWGGILMNSTIFVPPGLSPGEEAHYRQVTADQIQTLWRAWEATRKLIEKSASPLQVTEPFVGKQAIPLVADA